MTAGTSSTATQRPHVVIVGGGFAGIAAMHTLQHAPVDVTIVDRHPYNTFQPLLYQVATGGLNPGDVTYPLRALAARTPNSRLARGRVDHIDQREHVVRLSDGRELFYDYLLLAQGATTNYFGIPGAAENSHALYTRADALQVRDYVFGVLEAAAAATEPPTCLRVIIVGGGPTGVETAGALAELNAVRGHFFPELTHVPTEVTLVEQLPTLLNGFAEDSREFAASQLQARGVQIRTGTAVAEVHHDGIVVADGSFMPSDVTIWAAGVTIGASPGEWGFPQGKGGRVPVQKDLRVRGSRNVFAAGDLALVEDQPLPQLAQPAIQTGRHAGRQIERLVRGEPTARFRYRDKGTMATVGRGAAIAELPMKIHLRGTIGWFAWLILHIAMLLGNRNRAATFVNLGAEYVTWPRHLNVIVGDTAAVPEDEVGGSKTSTSDRQPNVDRPVAST